MDSREVIDAFRQDFFDRGGSHTTWKSEYQKVLKWLPLDKPLSPEVLYDLIRRSEPNTRTRVRFVMVVKQFADFAGIDCDPKRFKGNYRPSHPRTIPDDRLIVETWTQLKNPGWKWVFGMMATYGLRNHEVFRLDYSEIRSGNPVVEVLSGKTHDRRTWAFHPEWIERFGLALVQLPNVDVNRPNDAVGHSVTEYFADRKLPLAPYDLRHAYAIRTLTYGIDPSVAARYMGHSRDVHERTYRRWIDKARLQAEYDRAMNRSDRPRPPSI